VGERLVWQRLASLAGVAQRQRAVAGADGNHAARQRIETALLAPAVEEAADGGRARPQRAPLTRTSAPAASQQMKARKTLVSAT
jgi:hypothetical protein